MIKKCVERIVLRDKDGWSIQKKFFLFHPHSYGVATLMRIGVIFRGRKIVLHHFRPHQEFEFHDHPWSFRTFVLWGTYVDESLGDHHEIIKDVLRAPCTRYREADHAHRTSCKRHVWTFVITSRKKRQWCMGTPEAWICGGKITDFDQERGMVRIKDE